MTPQVTMDSVVVQGKRSYCDLGCNAIIDTGTSLIGGPTDVIRDINSVLGARQIGQEEYAVECREVNELPDITLAFGGK